MSDHHKMFRKRFCSPINGKPVVTWAGIQHLCDSFDISYQLPSTTRGIRGEMLRLVEEYPTLARIVKEIQEPQEAK